MDDAISDWLLIVLGGLADLAVLYGGYRLIRKLRHNRTETPPERKADASTARRQRGAERQP